MSVRSLLAPRWVLAAAFVVVCVTKLTILVVTDYCGIAYIDQVIFEQAMRSLWQGKGLYAPFESFTPGYTPASHLAIHFHGWLFPLSALYWLFPYTFTTKVVEIPMAYAAAFPISWLGTSILGSGWLGCLLGVFYLLDWPLWHSLRSDFQPINFAMLAYALALWWLECRQDRRAFVALLGALVTKETEIFTVFLIGIYAILRRRDAWRIAVASFTASAIWAGVVFGVVIPHYSQGRGYFFTRFISRESGGVAEMVRDLLVQPESVLGQSESQSRANKEYVIYSVNRMYGLLLLDPVALVPAASTVAAILLSDQWYHKLLWRRYTNPILPFLFVALAMGLRRFSRFLAPRIGWTASGVSATVLVMIVVQNAVVIFEEIPVDHFTMLTQPFNDFKKMKYLLEMATQEVPPGVIVSANQPFVRYLYNDIEDLHLFPNCWEAVDFHCFSTHRFVSLSEKAGLSFRLAAGFVPVSPLWMRGIFVLAYQPDNVIGRDFVRDYREYHERGIDFTLSNPPVIQRYFGGLCSEGDAAGAWSETKDIIIPFYTVGPPTPDYQITLAANHPLEQIPDQRWYFSVNGRLIRAYHPVNRRETVTLDVPSAYLSGFGNTFEIALADTFVPAEIGMNTDQRTLGIKLMWLKIAPRLTPEKLPETLASPE